MYESISKNNELENEMTLDMSYFWYSDVEHMVRALIIVPIASIHSEHVFAYITEVLRVAI